MHWLEMLVASGFLGLILGPIIHKNANMERWLRLAQTILAQLLDGVDSRGNALTRTLPRTVAEQTALVATVTQKLRNAGVPAKYAAGLASEALRLEQRIAAPIA